MRKPPTSLPDQLNAVADQVRPVDLYDRVLHTSRGLRRRRNAGGAWPACCWWHSRSRRSDRW